MTDPKAETHDNTLFFFFTHSHIYFSLASAANVSCCVPPLANIGKAKWLH